MEKRIKIRIQIKREIRKTITIKVKQNRFNNFRKMKHKCRNRMEIESKLAWDRERIRRDWEK